MASSNAMTELLRAATRDHLRSRWTLAAAVIATVAAAIMAFIPLFNVLGFGFSFVMAVVISPISLLAGAGFVRRVAARMRAHGTTSGRSSRVLPSTRRFLAAVLGRAVLGHLALLVPPLVIIAANGLRVRNCDWLFGALAFILLPVASCVLATAIGVVIGLLCGDRRWRASALGVAVFVASVIYAVWRFHAAPPVFSYNLFGGYFPGNLYDEGLSFTAPFYWARLLHIAFVLALLGAAGAFLDVPRVALSWDPRPGERRVAWAGTTAMAGGLALLLFAMSGRLGFDIDAEDIARSLGARYDTEHFTIYYPLHPEIERNIHVLAEDHEYRYSQATRDLGAAPERITSFYFASADDKHRMMGARNVYMAKPWRNEIYLNHRSFPHAVLRHEIVHVVASEFGSPVFRVSAGNWLGLPVLFNVGLIEGIAVAADWPDHFDKPLTPHQSVKALRELGMAPPVRRLLSTGFLAFSSSRSYTMAGSFVRYLLETQGAERLRILYRSGGDFDAAYGRSETELVAEWSAMIDGIELPRDAAEIVRERFRRPSIFARPCPDAIGRQRRELGELLARSDVVGAVELGRRVCDQAPGEPRYQLELARVLTHAGRSAEAAAIYRELAGNAAEMSSVIRARALRELASMAARSGDVVELEDRLDDARRLALPDGEQRNVSVQHHVAGHIGPAGDALRAYFWGPDPAPGGEALVRFSRAARAVHAEPALGLGHYLTGRVLSGYGAAEDAATALARAIEIGFAPVGEPGDTLLRREAARLLAETGYLAGRSDLVERAATILMEPAQTEVTRLYGADWIERLAWKRAWSGR